MAGRADRRADALISGVSAELTSTRRAPFLSATRRSEAAGCTSAEVPTTSIKRQRTAAFHAASSTSDGRDSPYQTTSGRSNAPHLGV